MCPDAVVEVADGFSFGLAAAEASFAVGASFGSGADYLGDSGGIGMRSANWRSRPQMWWIPLWAPAERPR